jgi:hypothetical protein
MAGITDQAIAILEATKDGDKLHPWDLALLEDACKRLFECAGLEAFAELHAKVTTGDYIGPFDALILVSRG